MSLSLRTIRDLHAGAVASRLWRIPASVAALGLVMAGALALSAWLGTGMVKRLVPLQDASMIVKYELGLFDVELVRRTNGDGKADLKPAFEHLERAEMHVRLMIEGGSDGASAYLPVEDPRLRKEAALMLVELGDLHILAERVMAEGRGASDSENFRKLHGLLADAFSQADDVEDTLHATVRRQLREYEAITAALLLASLLFTAGIANKLYGYGRSRLADIAALTESGAMLIQKDAELDRTLSKVRESEAMFRSLVEESLAGVYIIKDWRFAYVNPRVAGILGYTQRELTDFGNILELVHPDDRALVEEKVNERLTGKTFSVHYKSRWLKKGGRVIAIEVIGARTEVEGAPALIGTMMDVTEQSRAEGLLRKSEERYRNLVELSTDIIYITDKNGDIAYMNEAGFRALETAPAEVIGAPWSKWAHPDDRERSREKFLEMVEKGADVFDFENRYVSKGGRVLYALHNIRVLRDDHGAVVGTQGIARDITIRKRAEGELRKFKFILDGAGEEFYLINPDAKFSYVNRAAAKSLGYSVSEAVGLSVMDIDPGMEIEGFNSHFEELKARDLPPFETTHKTKGGALVPKEIKSVYIKIGDEERICAFARDITERKGLEAQRADFYSMVTHDLKSPLTAILGFSEYLLDYRLAKLDPDAVEMVGAIKKSGNKLMVMVEDFLTLSSILSGHPSLNEYPEDMAEVLREVATEGASIARTRGLTFKAKLPDGLPKVVIDRKLVSRAVANLISNAMTYTPSGGNVTLDAGLSERAGKSCVVVAVTDNGPGISRDERDKVFEKYYRSARTSGVRGTGLGLAIVKSVAEAHGGWVELDSEEGVGSSFRLILPAAPAAATAA